MEGRRLDGSVETSREQGVWQMAEEGESKWENVSVIEFEDAVQPMQTFDFGKSKQRLDFETNGLKESNAVFENRYSSHPKSDKDSRHEM